MEDTYRRILSMLDKVPGDDIAIVLQARTNLTFTLLLQRKYQAAEQVYVQILEAQRNRDAEE